MNDISGNVDPAEQQKFDRIAASWWDPDGESRPLHDLNPARLAYITERVELKGEKSLMWDVVVVFCQSPWPGRGPL